MDQINTVEILTKGPGLHASADISRTDYNLAEAMPHLVWMTDTNGAVTYINKNCLEYVGSHTTKNSAESINIEHWMQALHPEDAEHSFKKWSHCILTGMVFHHEYRLRRHDGVYHWFLGRAIAVRDSKNRITRWIGTATDIESQKILFSNLQRSRNQLQVILEGMTDGVTALDRNGRIIYANRIGAQMCGFDSVEEMISTPDEEIMSGFNLYDEEGFPFPVEKLPGCQALMGVRNPSETVVQIVFKTTNEVRWAIVNAAPIFDEKGQVHYAVSIFRDFTTHKRNEQILKNREASLQLIADAGIILNSSLNYFFTLQKLTERIIPQMADWCVIDITNTANKPQSIVWHTHPQKRLWAEDYQRDFRFDWNASDGAPRVIKTGHSELYSHVTDEMLKASAQSPGQYTAMKRIGMSSIMIVPIIGGHRILGAMTFIASDSGKKFNSLDLTAAEDIGRRAGQAIDKALLFESEREARKVAENANQSKSTFLANMSHEIRTPLNALIGFNELLRSDSLSAKERIDYHQIIQRNGELLLYLIDDILDLSKVESGHLVLELLNTSVSHLISEISKSKSLKAEAKGLTFLVDIDTSVPEEIVTDSLRLKQILNNIVGNAIKFTAAGHIRTHINFDQKNSQLIFTVSDTGIGIPENKKDKLFQPFIQADASVTRRYGGTGLGLILSQRLAQKLGGQVYLKESSIGRGSTFVIEIATSLSSDRPAEKNVFLPEKPLQGRKILVVDDSIDNTILIEHILKKRGAIVESADNGEIGVTKALSQTFDIVLMDVQMPIMDGHTAIRLLREKHYVRPIISLTAHAMHEDRKKCIESGADDFLTKPIRTDLLLQTLSRYLK